MAIKKNETFVRRLSTEQTRKPNPQTTTPRPDPVKLQQETFQAAVETVPRKVRMTVNSLQFYLKCKRFYNCSHRAQR